MCACPSLLAQVVPGSVAPQLNSASSNVLHLHPLPRPLGERHVCMPLTRKSSRDHLLLQPMAQIASTLPHPAAGWSTGDATLALPLTQSSEGKVSTSTGSSLW